MKRLEHVKKREERLEKEEREILRNIKLKEEEKQVKLLKKERLDREKRLHEREKKLQEIKEEQNKVDIKHVWIKTIKRSPSSRRSKNRSRSRTVNRSRSRSRSRTIYSRSKTCLKERIREKSSYNLPQSTSQRSRSQYKRDEKSTRDRSKSRYGHRNANRLPLGRRRSRSMSNSSQTTCSTNKSVFDGSRLGNKISVRHRLGSRLVKRKRSRSRS